MAYLPGIGGHAMKASQLYQTGQPRIDSLFVRCVRHSLTSSSIRGLDPAATKRSYITPRFVAIFEEIDPTMLFNPPPLGVCAIAWQSTGARMADRRQL